MQKILLDDLGLQYICQTYERFSHVALILGKMVHGLAKQQSPRLLKHVVRRGVFGCMCAPLFSGPVHVGAVAAQGFTMIMRNDTASDVPSRWQRCQWWQWQLVVRVPCEHDEPWARGSLPATSSWRANVCTALYMVVLHVRGTSRYDATCACPTTHVRAKLFVSACQNPCVTTRSARA